MVTQGSTGTPNRHLEVQLSTFVDFRVHSRSLLAPTLPHFCDFGCPWGVPLGLLFQRKRLLGLRYDFWLLFESLLGGAGARGLVPLSLLICKYWNQISSRPVPLKGWGQILRLRPCRRPLYQPAIVNLFPAGTATTVMGLTG